MTSSTAPSASVFSTRAVSTMGNGQSLPDVSIVESGWGSVSGRIGPLYASRPAPFNAARAACPGSDPRVGSPTVPTPASLRLARVARLAAVAALAAFAPAASAVEAPSGLVFSAGVGGGVELGLEGEKAGLAETELSLGWEHERTGLRPEVAFSLGLAPDTHVAVRPGVRWAAPEIPVQLRVALDWSNAREEKRWRWLLVGGAFELRWTSAFSLFAGLDLGFPIGRDAGLPLIARGGASFRF